MVDFSKVAIPSSLEKANDQVSQAEQLGWDDTEIATRMMADALVSLYTASSLLSVASIHLSKPSPRLTVAQDAVWAVMQELARILSSINDSVGEGPGDSVKLFARVLDDIPDLKGGVFPMQTLADRFCGEAALSFAQAFKEAKARRKEKSN